VVKRRRDPEASLAPASLQRFGGAIRLGLVLAILVGVNVYVFFFSRGA